ncbi:hypothetical protein GE09DRAFT_63357 [Coniochaeta sp. 2T2.1]|nr:hypothetical protein GE09DRAFT_63357 [Coniochaeta sp. 2T2.1]
MWCSPVTICRLFVILEILPVGHEPSPITAFPSLVCLCSDSRWHCCFSTFMFSFLWLHMSFDVLACLHSADGDAPRPSLASVTNM